MKRFLTIIMLILFAGVMLTAQTTTKVLTSDQRIHAFNNDDIINDSTDQANRIFDLSEKTSIQYYQIKVSLDTISTPAVTTSPYATVYLKQSIDGSTYSNIDTVTYYGTADTSFVLQDITTGLYYPYIKVEVNGVDSLEFTLDEVIGNFLDK